MKDDQDQKNKLKRKPLGYRTPNRFRRLVQHRNPALFQRTRSLGGHR